jgi:LysR family hydrogen peroxide-inducible transcriptional activator
MRLAPHAFTLRQLQYVAAVAEELSFRKAADRCGVSQPSLSAQIAQLEDALGVQLFERDNRHVRLSPAGEALLARARRILVESDDLGRAAEHLGDPLAGTLRIGVIPTISPYLLPTIGPAAQRHLPRLRIAWVEDKTPTLVARLEAGAIDGALLALEADLGVVDHAEVAKDPFVLAAPANHALAKKRARLTTAELRGADVLLLDEGHCLRDQALAFCTWTEFREHAFRATSLTTLAQMVQAGAGVTLLPKLSVPTEAERFGLTVRRFEDPEPHRTIAFVWRRGAAQADAFRELAKLAKDVMSATA